MEKVRKPSNSDRKRRETSHRKKMYPNIALGVPCFSFPSLAPYVISAPCSDVMYKVMLNVFRKRNPYATDSAVQVFTGERFFSSPQRPDQIWAPPSTLSNAYQGLFH
jgi:hypothetical protein